jgi:hypothetical protein
LCAQGKFKIPVSVNSFLKNFCGTSFFYQINHAANNTTQMTHSASLSLFSLCVKRGICQCYPTVECGSRAISIREFLLILYLRFTVLFLKGYVGNVEEAFAYTSYTVKERLAIFPSPAGMSQTKFSMAGNNSIIPGLGEFG